jgi:hypothetical protein
MEKKQNRNLMLYDFKNVDIQWQQPQEIYALLKVQGR